MVISAGFEPATPTLSKLFALLYELLQLLISPYFIRDLVSAKCFFCVELYELV